MIDSILNANTVNGSNCWQPQTFIMTSVTQELFNEDGDYPYLVTRHYGKINAGIY